ncbi:MAG: hypothetical protein ABH833_01745 [Parcubacteria group bacterium]
MRTGYRTILLGGLCGLAGGCIVNVMGFQGLYYITGIWMLVVLWRFFSWQPELPFEVVSIPADCVVEDNGPAEKMSIIQLQEDAPSCMDCGSLMVQNGDCYKCLNCGSTLGCS